MKTKSIEACLLFIVLLIAITALPTTAMRPTVFMAAPPMAPNQQPWTVYGQVMDGNRTPIPNAYVALIDANNTTIAYYQANTGSDGNYTFNNINTTVAYKLYVNTTWSETYTGIYRFSQNDSNPIKLDFMIDIPTPTPTQTATPTPTSTPTPGFEAIIAILGLSGIVALRHGLKP